jgi:hypothetical protein
MTINDQRGVVALLTTIFVGILLSVITVGLMAQMVSELRQSGDYEQSQRAYYAARSGVEDAVSKVVSSLQNNQRPQPQIGCNSGNANLDLDPTSPGAVGWTCQQILFSGSPSGKLGVSDSSVQIDTSGGPAFASMKLEWDQSTGSLPPGFFNAPASFPAGGSWTYAAALELTSIEYPQGSFNAANTSIKLYNALIRPTTGGVVNPSFRTSGNNPISGTCNPAAGSYHCSVIFNGFDGSHNYIFRIRSRYVGTDYRFSFFDGSNASGSPVLVPDGDATIDVTARAGDAFRRVIYKVPYTDGVASGLNFVIYSDTDICKNMTVYNSLGSVTGCPY